MNNKSNIQFVTCVPRNKFYCAYYLNNMPEAHSMKYDDLFHFLVNLCPKLSAQINELLLVLHLPLILDVNNNTVQRLEFDFSSERDRAKFENRRKEYKNVLKQYRNNPTKQTLKKQFKFFDSFFNNMFKKNPYEK